MRLFDRSISGRIPRFVERGMDGLAVEARTLPGLAFHLSAGVPFRRGWQAIGESGGGPPRVAFVPECSRTARQPVWLPEGTVYGRCCSPCPLPGWGGRAARLRGVGCVAGRGQRLQQHSLGQDMPGPRVSSGTHVPAECGPGISLGPKHRLQRPWRGDDWEGGVPRGPTGFRAGSAAVEHRVRRGASDADVSGLGPDVLRWRHVGAGLGQGVGRNRPSGEAGGGPRGSCDQRIGAENVPWKVRGNVVLP